MAFDLHNSNNLLSAILIVFGFAEGAILRPILLKKLAANPQAKPEAIRIISMAILAGAGIMLAIACFFYYGQPIK